MLLKFLGIHFNLLQFCAIFHPNNLFTTGILEFLELSAQILKLCNDY